MGWPNISQPRSRVVVDLNGPGTGTVQFFSGCSLCGWYTYVNILARSKECAKLDEVVKEDLQKINEHKSKWWHKPQERHQLLNCILRHNTHNGNIELNEINRSFMLFKKNILFMSVLKNINTDWKTLAGPLLWQRDEEPVQRVKYQCFRPGSWAQWVKIANGEGDTIVVVR